MIYTGNIYEIESYSNNFEQGFKVYRNGSFLKKIVGDIEGMCDEWHIENGTSVDNFVKDN